MPETSTPPASPARINSAALRIVLFGLPDAGKSSLLGALAQAAQTQEHALNGRLVDESQGLIELQQRLYEDRPRETLEEIVPYPVRLEPLAVPGQAAGSGPLEAVLVDCDGRVANELLAQQGYLAADGSLTRAILDADTLVLAVDASAGSGQLERDFGQFGRFLQLLETSRGRRSDVGGLPVYLVLTKCDLLAQPNDTSLGWVDRIEERKGQVGQRFRDFLDRQSRPEPRPFGSIDLHLWATSVKRPALADAPPRPREPYGVGELFRQCLESARDFHQQESRAGAKLRWAVFGSVGLLVVLGALAFLISFLHPDRELNPLEMRVDDYRARYQDELASKNSRVLDNRIRELQSFARDKEAFGKLPGRKQEYIRDQLQELTALRKVYEEYKRKLGALLQRPESTSLEQLRALEDDLRRLKDQVPERFRAEVAKSEEGRVLDRLLKDNLAKQDAVPKAAKWFQDLVQEGDQLLREADNLTGKEVRMRAKRILDRARALPAPETTVPGGATLTWSEVYNFRTVADARDRWKDIQPQLEKKVP